MARKPHVQYRNLSQLLNADPGLATADFDVLSGVTASAAELNLTDALSASGNATASKVVVLSSTKSLIGLRREVTASAAGAALTEGHSRGVFTNEGAEAAITFVLPAALAGMEMIFYVMAAYELRIDPSGTQTIALPSSGAQGGAGKYLTADAVGEWVRLLCVKAGQWQVVGYTGTWAHEG